MKKEYVTKDLFGILAIVNANILGDDGKYLDYKNCKCWKKLIGKLGEEECSRNIDENEMIYNKTLNVIPLNSYKKVHGYCTPYVVMFPVFLVTSTVISTVFIYFHCYLKSNITNVYY